MASPRVLLVEDHSLLQRMIQNLLVPYVTFTAVLDRAEAVEPSVRALQPDVLILDVSLPGRSGMQVLPELRKNFPDLGIVIATNHTQAAYRTEALKRGADAFVSKDRLREDLWPAIQVAVSARQLTSSLQIPKKA